LGLEVLWTKPKPGDIDGLGAFVRLLDLKLYLFSLFQRAVPRPLDVGEMDENVCSISTGNKPVSFRGIKPLDLTAFTHVSDPPMQMPFWHPLPVRRPGTSLVEQGASMKKVEKALAVTPSRPGKIVL
jgi:hypothetical protein